LLTATVRWEKSGGTSRVHVSPELVEISESGPPSSKWRQPFDASLTNVFQVQSEIAAKVAQSLGVALGTGEEERLARKPTENLAAYDAFLKGENASKAMAATDPPTLRKALGYYEQAVALDPNFAQAWARVSVASTLLYANAVSVTSLAKRAREAADKAVALAPARPEGYQARGNYQRLVAHDMNFAQEQYATGLRLAPGNPDLLGSQALAEQALGRWDAALASLDQAAHLDPRSVTVISRLGRALVFMRRYREARKQLERALTLAPSNMNGIEYRAMTFLGEGDLGGARASLQSAVENVEATALVAYLAQYNDLVWVLDEEQREVLLRLTPDACDGDRAAWGLCLAQADLLKGDAANLRVHAEEARRALEEQLRETPNDDQRHVLLGLALALLGRKEEAVREGMKGVALDTISKDALGGPYNQHQLAKIYILVGEPEKALDQLVPLLKIPYLLSPAWLKIDPNFDPLRKNPRFQKLVASAK
jgi:tetratricopeptide (TPR) repeat protein